MKLFKRVVLVLVVFLGFFITSCSSSGAVKFDNDINLFKDKEISLNNLSFKTSKIDYKEYDNHLLEVHYKLSITNSGSFAILNFSDAKLYGNDELLKEKVYEKFDYTDLEYNKLFDTYKLEINKNDTKVFEFDFYIPDGNKDAKIAASFKLNNVSLMLYSYNYGYEPESFCYVHNPLYNEKVLADAIYDKACVFGFKPNSTGSLKQYTTYDWTKKDDVLGYKQDRIKYVSENDAKLKELEDKLTAEGKSIEEVARACSNLRNQIRLDQYKNDPEGLEKLKARNLEKYGHEEGPLPDELFEKYGSWLIVLEKSYSTNPGMDACCGVYDTYYYLYR